LYTTDYFFTFFNTEQSDYITLQNILDLMCSMLDALA